MTKPPILVVDDEPEILESLDALLRPEFEVHTALSGKAAIEALRRVPVHVVMTDQRMPDMTGVELLHHVHGEFPEAVRLVFTGYADVKAVIEAINQGRVSRYVTKPWDPDELIVVLRQACVEHDQVVERTRLLRDAREALGECLSVLDGRPEADHARDVVARLDSALEPR